tara:strand:- start:6783 stop:7229 length:447 start_codon:yes stop_codon:yes gene_type:complete
VKDKFLIIEDEPADATLLKRALSGAAPDVDIQVLQDGDEALSHLLPSGDDARGPAENRPTCILLDLKLRKLDGHAVLKALKEDHRTRRIPVVILTSSSDPTDVKLAYDLGANSYLIKPVRFQDLGQMSERLIDYWTRTNHFPRDGHAF